MLILIWHKEYVKKKGVLTTKIIIFSEGYF